MFASLIEARAWIKSAGQFAPSRFDSREEALDFVYKLYRCGAVIVSVHDKHTLLVEMPEDDAFRVRVFEVCNGELSRGGGQVLSDDGQATIELCFGGTPG